MRQNRRLTNLFAAGSMVGLLAITVFLFDSNRLPTALAEQLSTLTAAVEGGSTLDAETVDPLQLQTENEALRATIQTMQAREVEFQTMIAKANETLTQFENNASAQVSDASSTAATLGQRNQELQQAVQLLQDRETQFRTQLENANQTIRELEGAVQQRQSALQTLQSQNGELVKAVQLMQERERQYQAQLQAATQALQNSGATQAGSSGSSANSNSSYQEHEEHHEHEEHDDDD